MAFEDVARRMTKRHQSSVPPLVLPGTEEPPTTASAVGTHLQIAAGILIMIGSAMAGLFLLDDRLVRKLAIAGVVVGIAMIISATRRH